MTSPVRRGLLGLLAVCLFPMADVQAQSGALFLLTPFGGRAVGRGEAVAADTTLGTEGIWWNPAAMARLKEREGTFNYGSSIVGNAFMLAAALPSKVFGTFAAGAYMLDYGNVFSTDSVGNAIGNISTRNYLLAASYASPIGRYLNAGITYKYIAFAQTCSGGCPGLPLGSAAGSSALDVGAQYQLPEATRTTLGVSVRNLGQPLQLRDKAQADPLPRVVQIGLRTRLPLASLAETGASVDVSVDVLRTAERAASGESVGAVLGYREQVFLSAGYKRLPLDAGGAALGLSVQRGAFGFDLSRRFDRLAEGAGQPSPTYFALRFQF